MAQPSPFTFVSRLAYFVFALQFASLVAALQVSPNSPCADVCIDSTTLDTSDPNSSNTLGKDIVCKDDDYDSKPNGQKFQRCLSCLQDSSFSQGSEHDQEWFLYNLRYSLGYCIFSYPNATGIESSPCVTQFACGNLKNVMEKGMLKPADTEAYAYCDTDKGALSSDYEQCMQCVQADGDHAYLSNFLVALEAGCEQRPAAGITIGLNETIFSKTTVDIIEPTPSSAPSSSKGPHLTTTVIVGIAVGGLVLLALAAGCVYMQFRKRKNRAARAKRVRASSLSFRCQTHVTPHSPEFTRDYRDDDEKASAVERPYVGPMAALNSNPISASESSRLRAHKPASITTTLPAPPPARTSPKVFSPDDYTTPTSTTSIRSNAPLLNHKPYLPAEYSNSPPQAHAPTFVVHSSPLINQSSFHGGDSSPHSLWEEQKVVVPARDLVRKKARGGVGAPVEISRIQTSFAPPPRR